MILPRTVTPVHPEEEGGPRTLGDYEGVAAYVLLGDPGAGKTTEFRSAVAAGGGNATFISVRDFLTLEPSAHPEWQTGPLFLDGLDEVRAGSADGRTSLDRIRCRLDALGRPPFRLSCREADWLGGNDRERLAGVSPDGSIRVLRLDPLGDFDVRDLVASRLLDTDSDHFLAEARSHGLDEILQNPQTLELLVKAFEKRRRWPESRREVMEWGVTELARETNEEHWIATRAERTSANLDVSVVLEAAGWMSAVHLLGGGLPHRLGTSVRGADEVLPNDYDVALRPAVRAALRTRLFAARGEERFEPVHANLAAFLAARTLADLVEKGLPETRVLSLLAGEDGAPPTPLRGLAAWLAALSPALRRTLIERDPVAVLMYGDIRGFETEEQGFLLQALTRDPHRLEEALWSGMKNRALARPALMPTLRAIVEDPDRSDSRRGIVRLAVEALGLAAPDATSAHSLLEVVRDSGRSRDVRNAALDGWIRQVSEDSRGVEQLRSLLHAVRKGVVEDPYGEILGTLLDRLYSRGFLTPREVWEHLAPPAQSIIGRLWKFLRWLRNESPEADLPEHLDILADGAAGVPEKLARLGREGLAIALVARAVRTHGDRIEIDRLVPWLRVGLDEHGMLRPKGADGDRVSGEIRAWLIARPEKQKAIIRFALRTEPIRSFESPMYHLGELLYRSELPKGIERWHLDEAVAAPAGRLRRYHLQQFLAELSRRPVEVDAALAEARSRLGDDLEAPGLLWWELPEGHLERTIQYQHLRRTGEGDSRLLSEVRSHRKELAANAAPPGLLDALARRYYRGFRRDGSTGGQRGILEALHGDETLGQVSVRALSRTIERPDLPSVRELIRLRRRNRMSLFIWPVLMGLAERRPDEIAGLDAKRLGSALACRLLQPGLARRPPWYERCAAERPDLVAEVLVLVARVLLIQGDGAIEDFYRLRDDDDHRAVARRSVLPLLQAFPARARRSQLHLLDALLEAGLNQLGRCGIGAMDRIVAGKADQPSTTTAARVRWMAAGLLRDPNRYIPLLSETLSRPRAPVDGLKDFFLPVLDATRSGIANRLTPASLAFLIQTLGQRCDPRRLQPGLVVRIGAPQLVRQLIHELSGIPGAEATRALEGLRSSSELLRWRPVLDATLSDQRVLRRDASHVFPEPKAIIEALRDRSPASAADLRALLVDRLGRLARDLRTTNANLWRQFWNEIEDRPEEWKPKHENACRDALLAMLRPLLPQGCDAQPEGQYARNRRADLRVACGRWNVPVEIKKNRHADLWRAAREQLLASYATDPATEGLGIYLVLWFGPLETAPRKRGVRPRTPEELETALVEGLTVEERRRAAVVVMDGTPPN